MKKFLQKLQHKILSKYFWRNNRKRLLIILSGIVMSVLMLLLLIGGQRDIGVQEAGRQLNLLSQNIRKAYQTKPNFWGLSTQQVIAQKMYPSSMFVENGILKGYFGTPTTVGNGISGTKVMPSDKKFVIAYHDLSRAQCVGLGSYKFNSNFWLGVRQMVVSNSSGEYIFEWGTDKNKLPAKKSRLKKFCRQQNNVIAFYFE